MKFSLLQKIVTEYAYQLKEDAGYMGSSFSDGGCQDLLTRLNDYRNSFIVKMNLRPSEFYKLDEIEVGEPSEFYSIIEKHKIKLAKNIKL